MEEMPKATTDDTSWLDRLAEQERESGIAAFVSAVCDIEDQLIALGEGDWLA